jgi:hypothetical protein
MPVYFIQCGDYVKIGWSKQLSQRFRTLQKYNPYPLTLLCSIDQDREKELQSKFWKYHTHGEWFTLSDEIKLFIANEKKLPKNNISSSINFFSGYRFDLPIHILAHILICIFELQPKINELYFMTLNDIFTYYRQKYGNGRLKLMSIGISQLQSSEYIRIHKRLLKISNRLSNSTQNQKTIYIEDTNIQIFPRSLSSALLLKLKCPGEKTVAYYEITPLGHELIQYWQT